MSNIKKVSLPPLHKLQQEVYDDTSQFKVLACGRRWGKSALARVAALDVALNYGGYVWWVAPAYSTANDHWEDVKRMVQDAPFLDYKNEQRKYLRFKTANGMGQLMFKSADKPDNLRGSGLDFVVLDEAAFMDKSVWYEIVAPMLADAQNRTPDIKTRAMIISTPKGVGNWFHHIYGFGQEDNNALHIDGWKSWRFPSATNPFLDKKYIEQMKRVTPKHQFEQEYLAIFQMNEGGAFTNLENAFTEKILQPMPYEEQLENGIEVVIGVDFARKGDWTAISIWDKNTGRQVDLQRVQDTNFSSQITLLGQIIDMWNPTRVYAEQNSIGYIMVERMREEFGALVKPVYMTNSTKRNIIERLSARIDTGAAKLLEVQDAHTQAQYEEFSSYQINKSASGLTVTYSAPRGKHDDTVMAAALANIGIRRGVSVEFINNVFYA